MTDRLPLARLLERRLLRVGFQRHTPPFSYAAPDGRWPLGYSVALAQAVLAQLSRRLGVQLALQPVEVTSSTRVDMLERDLIDIECGSTTITDERRRRVSFSRPIFQTAHRLARRGPPSAPGAASGCVAGIEGSTSHQTFLQAHPAGEGGRFKGFSSIGEAFEAFQHDPEVDGLVADEVILAGLLQGLPSSGSVHTGPALGGEYYGFVMRLQDLTLQQLVDDALEALFLDPAFPARYAPWFEQALPGLGYSLGLDFSQQLSFLAPQRTAPSTPAKDRT